MDINYLTDNNNLYGIYISDENEKTSTQIDEEMIYYLFNYLYERIFINYLFIIFFLSCGGTIFFCNYEKNKKQGYVIINNEDTKPVKGEIIEKV